MESVNLKAEPREVTGKQVSQLRRQGLTPGVLYGKGIEPQSLQFEAKQLTKVLKEAGGHKLIALQIGNQKPVVTLAREIQRNFIKHVYTHVDLQLVQMDVKIKATVPFVYEGASNAIKTLSCILTHGLDEIEIECLPGDLPDAIVIDLSRLENINDTLHVSDLVLPNGVTALSDADSVVAKVELPRASAGDEAMMAAAVAEPEVLTKAKPKAEK